MRPGQVIPAAMFVEMAVDMLKVEDQKTIAGELSEFNCASKPSVPALDGLSDIEKGYLIGLETARALLATNPTAVQNKVSI